MHRALVLVALGLVACKTGPAPEPKPEPAPTSKTETKSAPAPTEGVLRLGAAIEGNTQSVALADVAKKPDAYTNKTFTTTGTVTAVCQHMGCWMEIKDDASQAHIKMAGHSFFVPKTASGRKARIQAKLVPSGKEGACEGEGHEGMAAMEAKEGKKGCRAEAEEQLGRPLAKLELVADGVELL
ncbi:MAG: DUF4920 domain-containing protein [Labilithrix sp.]|nr:DUF4920 domain-containing protein [Labilithrix sp.]MCW5811206.1 DUF4920 domain-containing protein [Labilithrix sp.]